MISFDKDPLRYVLNLAYQQAMTGKGMERHGDDKPFDAQIWDTITKACGLGYPVGQAWKKSIEAKRMEPEPAIRELIGGINYLAMAIIAILKEK